MLDRFITPVVKPLLMPVVKILDKRGVTPDQVTLVGFFIGIISVPLLAN